MIETADIIKYLPYLRRYARALFGEQTRGDDSVKRCLQIYVLSTDKFRTDDGVKVGLFKLFHDNLGEQLGDTGKDQMGRQALLLSAMEEFSHNEVSVILGLDKHDVNDLITSALYAIERCEKRKVLIIEDEPIISMDLESIVTDLGHEIIGVAATHQEALELASEQQPGMILADIKLLDGSSGIDAVKDILKDFQIPVIFITAYPERLLSGERPEPTYLITKPYLGDTIKAVIGQVLYFSGG